MRKALPFLLILLIGGGGVRRAAAQTGESWSPLGPPAATVFALERDPFRENVLWAGTYFGGVYASADYGFNWTHLDAPFGSYSVFAIAFDPRRADTVYVGTFQNGVYKSNDAGVNWTSVNEGLADNKVQSVAVDPFDSDNVIAATTAAGLFRSTNGGANWSPINLGAPAGIAAKIVKFDPRRSGAVYAGTIGAGMFKSDDGGSNWSSLGGQGGSSVLSINFDPTDDAKMYVAADRPMGAYELDVDDGGWKNIVHDMPPSMLNEVVAHPTDNRLYAVTDGGIYRSGADREHFTNWTLWASFRVPPSTIRFDKSGDVAHVALKHATLMATADGGATWHEATAGLQNTFVGALGGAVGGDKSVIYAGSDLGVFVTSEHFGPNDGSRWLKSKDFLEIIFDVQAHPTQPGVVFAGTERLGVWKSADWGQTWSQWADGMYPARVYALARSHGATTRMYAATSSGIFLSEDDGRTWDAAARKVTIPTHVFTVATDPVRHPIAFFGGPDGQVYKTFDDGQTFQPAAHGLPKEAVAELKVAAWDRVYAVTAGGALYASVNDGDYWFETGGNLPARVTTIEVDPNHPQTIYAGTAGGGVYKSESSGTYWSQSGEGMGYPYAFSLKIDPRDARTIYAAGYRLYKSIDGAATWNDSSYGLPFGEISNLVIDSSDPQVIYAHVQNQGTYKTTNGGGSWDFVGDQLPTSAAPLLANSSNGETKVYAGLRSGGILASADGGTNWEQTGRGISVFVRGLVIDSRTPSTMYAGSLADGVFKTTDGGVSWHSVGLVGVHVLDMALNPQNSALVYAATSEGVALSADGGATWAYGNSPQANKPFVMSVAVDPQRPWVVYAGTGGHGVLRSTNGGLDWTLSNEGLTNPLILALAIDPIDSDVVYVGTASQGVLISRDGGMSWRPFDQGMFNKYVTSLLIDPVDHKTIYAGTEGGGVFKIKRQ